MVFDGGNISMRVQDFVLVLSVVGSVVYNWRMVKGKINGAVDKIEANTNKVVFLEKEITRITIDVSSINQIEKRIDDFKEEFRGKFTAVFNKLDLIDERCMRHIEK